MSTPRYHVHVDAAHMPLNLETRMTLLHGLEPDPFDHSFIIKGVEHKGHHFTKLIYDENSEAVKQKCEELAIWASGTDFVGLIQCEFIVEEVEWNGTNINQSEISFPFKVTKRLLDTKNGERFKKHELHLEINKTVSSSMVINAIKQSGLDMLENDRNVTFTASGNPKELLAIKKILKEFLNTHQEYFTGKFTYEATAFWSLHHMEEDSLPQIIDAILEIH